MPRWQRSKITQESKDLQAFTSFIAFRGQFNPLDIRTTLHSNFARSTDAHEYPPSFDRQSNLCARAILTTGCGSLPMPIYAVSAANIMSVRTGGKLLDAGDHSGHAFPSDDASRAK